MMELLPIDAASASEIDVTPPGWSPERMVRFLSLLAESGNVRRCASRCGLSAQSVYKLRRRDALFARGWAAALLLARGHAEQVLADRALEGVEEPIFFRGEQVGVRRRYDTRLLLAHMARLDRLAEDEEAEIAAGRFDELLAIVAGEDVPETVRSSDDDPWPRVREEFVGKAIVAAGNAALDAHYASPDRYDNGADERCDAALAAAGEVARTAAEAAWDGWFDRACAAVDRIDGADLPFRARTVSTVSTAGLIAGLGQPRSFDQAPDIPHRLAGNEAEPITSPKENGVP